MGAGRLSFSLEIELTDQILDNLTIYKNSGRYEFCFYPGYMQCNTTFWPNLVLFYNSKNNWKASILFAVT